MSRPMHRATRTPTSRIGTRVRTALAENRPSVAVAVLAGTLGSLVVVASAAAVDVVEAGDRTGSSATVAMLLPIASTVFLVVSLYVAAVVTVNTCATAIAGRTRVLALQRLLGAPTGRLRRGIVVDGVVVGAVGALAGSVVGTAAANGALAVSAAVGVLPPVGVVVPAPVVLVVMAVLAATVVAFLVCSRRVLALVPLQALASTVEAPAREAFGRVRAVTAAALVVVGLGGLVLAVLLGATSALAVFAAVGAGAVSFAGIVLGAPYLLPPVFRLVAAAASRLPMAVLAGRNALRTPGRSSRAAVGLLIAVTLVVTFSVGLATYERMLTTQVEADPVYYRGIHEQFTALSVMFTSLVGASGVIAAVGVVNVSALTVVQRRREFGLLRTVGATRAQVAALVTIETVVMVVTALVLGVALGVAYGWAGAYSLLGATRGATLIAPVLPLGTVVVVVVGVAVVALAAVVGPARRAVRTAPVTALAVE